MSSALGLRPGRARRLPTLVAVTAMVVTLLAATASPVAAASIRRTWQSQVANGAASGQATLTRYWAGNGTLGLNLVGLAPSTKYPVIAYRGTCLKPIIVAKLPDAVTDASGNVVSTAAVSTAVMNSFWAVARTTAAAIRIGSGTMALCGGLRSAVATRIAIASLKIDLPIVKAGTGYPLCNVAMYLRDLSQPVEAGVTFIYAHARTGMFLPLLLRSKVNNGASMLGMTVQVWTSNDLVTSYRIIKVRRHVTSLGNAMSLEPQQLWLQTSEGPRGTIPKLIVVAKRIGVAPATHAAANPVPHPVVCR